MDLIVLSENKDVGIGEIAFKAAWGKKKKAESGDSFYAGEACVVRVENKKPVRFSRDFSWRVVRFIRGWKICVESEKLSSFHSAKASIKRAIRRFGLE